MKFFTSLATLLFILLLPALSIAQQTTISLQVKNIDVAEGGSIRIGLYNAENFPETGKESAKAMVKAESETIAYTFTDIMPGEYALAVFHDQNNDGELNKNFFGVPNEAYGFSNNVFGSFGPPDFEDVAFIVEKDKPVELVINLE